MGSSTILRRWISRSAGMMRSGRSNINIWVSGNRMMSTVTVGVRSPPAPWLMLPPSVDGSGNTAYRFHCLVTKKEFPLTSSNMNIGGDVDIIKDVIFAGSSHGWLALYERRSSDLFLSNPMSGRRIDLPPPPGAAAPERVILSSEALAFMSYGSRHDLALCSLRRRDKEWTLFGRDREGEDFTYENIAYSSTHKRLLCVCQENDREGLSLEAWSFEEDQAPELEYLLLNKELDHDWWYHPWPGNKALKRICHRVNYLVCSEDSGELFLVVRHVNPRMGLFGSLTDKVLLSKYRGCHYLKTPYKTFDFDVYKIDFETREVILAEGSLGGLAMFLGINHPFAINPVPGLKADCIYFTDDNCLVEPTRLERTTYGGHDNAIFDYQTKEFYPCHDFYPIQYHNIRKILPLPLWFTPNHSYQF